MGEAVPPAFAYFSTIDPAEQRNNADFMASNVNLILVNLFYKQQLVLRPTQIEKDSEISVTHQYKIRLHRDPLYLKTEGCITYKCYGNIT